MTRTALTVCLALLVPTLAAAGPGGRREAAKDHAAIRDDIRDARQMEELQREYDRTAAARYWRRLDALEGRITEVFRRECDEVNRELVEAQREAAQSQQEVERGRQELADDARRRDRREFEDDRRDLNEDRRDSAKDQHDFMEKREYRSRLQSLWSQWIAQQRLHGAGSIALKHSILVELVDLAHREIRDDFGEVREDRGERRDDRRDWHDDRP